MNKSDSKWVVITSFAIIIMVFISIVNLIFIGKPNRLGTVDVQKIIAHEAQKLAAIYPKGDVPTEKLRGLIDSIKDKVQSLARDKKIILLSKALVLSGDVPDYTETFIKELEDRSNEQNR